MNGFYRRLSQLHLYVGLLLALLLWLIVFAGSLSFYRAELDSLQLQVSVGARWPEQLPTAEHSTALALRHLQQHAATARHWYIELPEPRAPYLKLHWQPAAALTDQKDATAVALMQQFLHPQTGEPLQAARALRFGATEHQLGGWFFQLHYNLLQLAGNYSRSLVAVAALLWLLLTVSGLFSLKGHWRGLFRPNKPAQQTKLQQSPEQQSKRQSTHKNQRRRHQQLAVLTLPFALLFASTGWLTQMFSENNAPQQLLYRQNPYQFYAELFPQAQPGAQMKTPLLRAADITALLQDAAGAFQGAAVGKISISAPGHSSSTVLLSSSASSRIGNQPQTLLFGLAGQSHHQQHDRLHNPALLQPAAQWQSLAPTMAHASEPVSRPLAQLRQQAYGLHQSLYAGKPLRLLLFSAGLLTCWMIWLAVKAALHRLTPGRRQQLLSVLLGALPAAIVLAALLLISQSLLWPGINGSLTQLFMRNFVGCFLLFVLWQCRKLAQVR